MQALADNLKEPQQQQKIDVRKIYKAVMEENPILREAQQVSSAKLKRLAKKYPQLQINTNGVLTASILENQKVKVVAVCSLALRQKIVREMHR